MPSPGCARRARARRPWFTAGGRAAAASQLARADARWAAPSTAAAYFWRIESGPKLCAPLRRSVGSLDAATMNCGIGERASARLCVAELGTSAEELRLASLSLASLFFMSHHPCLPPPPSCSRSLPEQPLQGPLCGPAGRPVQRGPPLRRLRADVVRRLGLRGRPR